MYCIRRVALQSAAAGLRQFVPKTTAPITALTAGRVFTAKQSSLFAVRCFSQTKSSLNFEEPKDQFEGQQGLDAVDQAEAQEVGAGEQTQSEQFVKRVQNSPEKPQNVVYVGNMDFTVDEEQIRTAFSKYGNINDVVIPLGPQGHRGFAFVYYDSAEAAEEACLGADKTFWHGRQIRVSSSTKSKETQQRVNGGRPSNCIYIGNIPYDTTDTELNRLFRDLPNVVGVRIAIDRTTGWPRGFAHAEFTTVESAEIAFKKLTGTMLGGRQLRLDWAVHRGGRNRMGNRGGQGSRNSFDKRMQQKPSDQEHFNQEYSSEGSSSQDPSNREPPAY